MAYNKETGMYEGYIYKIVNAINNKVYIGQTVRTIEIRWTHHKSSTRTKSDNLAIHNAMNKYGIENFNIYEIDKCYSNSMEELYELLNSKEINYISEYNSIVPNGYNISHGGSGVSGFGCRKILCCNPYTMELLEYNSIDEASLDTSTPTSNIISCCQNKIRYANNYIFKYSEDGIHKSDINNFFNINPLINQYDLFGNKINCFYSTNEAAKYIKEQNKLDKSVSKILKNIYECCRGNLQTAYGYVWRYNDEPFDKYYLKLDYPRNEEKRVDKPIDVYDIDGHLLFEFSNVNEAFLKLNLYNKQKNQALRCCDGKNNSAFGYIWRYHGDDFNKYSCAMINGLMRVNKYTTDGCFVERYNSYKEAAISVGTTNRKAISDCCNKVKPYYKNFLWFNINDQSQPDKTKIIA